MYTIEVNKFVIQYKFIMQNKCMTRLVTLLFIAYMIYLQD